jgi:hypothetical protein
MHSVQLCTLCTGQLGIVISYVQWALHSQAQWAAMYSGQWAARHSVQYAQWATAARHREQLCTVGTAQPGTVGIYVQWPMGNQAQWAVCTVGSHSSVTQFSIPNMSKKDFK